MPKYKYTKQRKVWRRYTSRNQGYSVESAMPVSEQEYIENVESSRKARAAEFYGTSKANYWLYRKEIIVEQELLQKIRQFADSLQISIDDLHQVINKARSLEKSEGA